MYKHRICGTEFGVPQYYIKLGKVQQTYISGSKAEPIMWFTSSWSFARMLGCWASRV